MTKSIYFDGLNLGLKHGTGVATYTRVLAGLARTMGYRTGLLYSRAQTLPLGGLASEVMFFDDQPARRLPGILHVLAKGLDYLVGMAGAQTRRVVMDGAVLTQPLGSKWVPSDVLYTSPNVFDRAQGFVAVFNRLYKLSFDQKPDLFHWTFPIPIQARQCPNIYTVHDLVPMRLPYTTLDHKRIYLRGLQEIAKKADHIVTVSEYSRRDIIRYLGVEESRVTNTYESVDIPDAYRFRPMDVVANELSGMFGLSPQGYFLFYGALEPKKNIARMVQAFLSAHTDIPLVMVASRSWLAEGETQLLNQVSADGSRQGGRRIIRIDYLPFALLMTLIKGARGVLFPSIYEGFGLPVLEAMAMGTPVITSNVSSLPEVAGDAALLVDPFDIDALRDAIAKLAADDDLAAELGRRGPPQAEKFSLAAYRARMEKLYASLM